MKTSRERAMLPLPRWIRRRLDLARMKDQSYRFLFEPGPQDEAVAIDCETTGLDRKKDDIVSVAAIRIKGNRILTSERFEATIRPNATMSPEAIKVHRLRHVDVADSRTEDVVIPELLRFLGGR